MPMIKIDGKDYDIDSLPDAAKQQLQSIQFVEAELARLGAQTAVFQTARLAYLKALHEALQPAAPSVQELAQAMMSADTLKL
jgi:hypothetical protein